MSEFGFGPASQSEQIVFGAERPGYSSKSVSLSDVQKWISFMKRQGPKRVCCLLPQNQLSYYDEELSDSYRKEFGQDHICWAPVEDYHLCDVATLTERILPFLKESDIKGEPVVVHCSGGSGRTGHVLAAWLVFGRGFSVEDALLAVKKMGRNPCEAVNYGNATTHELFALLQECQRDNVA